MKKTAILMSAYNGGAYIEEQIRSICQQEQEGCVLYIRDDGSKKTFVTQLRQLQKQYGFVLYEGANMGFLASFFWLLQKVGDADYYAFADQDDVWYPQKMQRAVNWLSKQEKIQNQSIPLLYHCAYEVKNAAGEITQKFCFSEKGYDFRRSLTENHYSGFAMVVNRRMRAVMLKADVQQLDYHDWWAANIAHGIGKAYFDPYVGAAHRAHEKNVTKITMKSRFHWLSQNLHTESAIKKRAQELERVSGAQLSAADRKVLHWFTDEKYHLGHALRKCFYPKRWRPVLSSELVLRFLMLLGRV